MIFEINHLVILRILKNVDITINNHQILYIVKLIRLITNKTFIKPLFKQYFFIL